jgi:HEAT repeat protein
MVRLTAIDALMRRDPRRPAQPIVDALRHAHGHATSATEPWRIPDADEVLELGVTRLGSLPLERIFTDGLASEHAFTREASARRLRELDAVDAVPMLVVVLDDPDTRVQRAAARALLAIGTPEALSAVRQRGGLSGVRARLRRPDRRVS